MAVPAGPHQHGDHIVILFGHGYDSPGVDQLSVRISNIFRQHNRIPQLVHVASKFTKVTYIGFRGESKRR